MRRLSGFQGMEVIDQDGRRLGHVFDLRTELKAQDQPPRLCGFLIGRGGLARRLGIRRGSAVMIEVEDVVRVESGQITVRGRDARRRPSAD